MAVRELPRVKMKTYTVADVWAMECDPTNEGRSFYLIDGALHEEPMTNRIHARIATKFSRYMDTYAEATGLGEVHVEASYCLTGAIETFLQPDVSYINYARLNDFSLDSCIPAMPDIAVEIKSPSNSLRQLRRKARSYLQHGASLVWLVLPERAAVELWQLSDAGQMQHRLIERAGELDGGAALPGFVLELSLLFPQENNGENHAG